MMGSSHAKSMRFVQFPIRSQTTAGELGSEDRIHIAQRNLHPLSELSNSRRWRSFRCCHRLSRAILILEPASPEIRARRANAPVMEATARPRENAWFILCRAQYGQGIVRRK